MRRTVLLHSGVALAFAGCVESADGPDARDVARRNDAIDVVFLSDIFTDPSTMSDGAWVDQAADLYDATAILDGDARTSSMDGSDASMTVDGRAQDASANNCVSIGVPRAFGTACAPGLVCDGAGACAIRRPCVIESAGRWLYPSGASRRLLETVFAYGRYYNFWINGDGSYEPLSPGGNDTTEITYWRGANGACAGLMPCSIASFDIFDSPDGAGGRVLFQSVVRAGRYYVYNVTAAPRMVDQGLLEGLSRYSALMMGPCGVQPEGDCNIDSRSLVHNWATGQLMREEVTTQGRRWVWDGAGRPVAAVPLGQRLDDVTRYAPIDGQGPCSARGLNCRFDAHFHDPSSGDEYVIAYGRLFAWANDAENTRRYVAGYGNELHTFSRYATGPCRVR